MTVELALQLELSDYMANLFIIHVKALAVHAQGQLLQIVYLAPQLLMEFIKTNVRPVQQELV